MFPKVIAVSIPRTLRFIERHLKVCFAFLPLFLAQVCFGPLTSYGHLACVEAHCVGRLSHQVFAIITRADTRSYVIRFRRVHTSPLMPCHRNQRTAFVYPAENIIRLRLKVTPIRAVIGEASHTASVLSVCLYHGRKASTLCRTAADREFTKLVMDDLKKQLKSLWAKLKAFRS